MIIKCAPNPAQDLIDACAEHRELGRQYNAEIARLQAEYHAAQSAVEARFAALWNEIPQREVAAGVALASTDPAEVSPELREAVVREAQDRAEHTTRAGESLLWAELARRFA